MQTLLADLRYGFRLLRQSPGFTTIAILALALGIGANTAIFSTLDAVLLRPLPYADPGRLVMVWEDASSIGFAHNTPAPANYFDWREQNHVFTDIAAVRGRTRALTGDGSAEQVLGYQATANLFSVLGIAPVIGRTFTETEDRDDAKVVVIGYSLWQSRYAGATDIISRTILMDGEAYRVIGVLPRDVVFRDTRRVFWIPMHVTPKLRATRGSHFLNCVARLKPGVTIAAANEEIRAIATRLRRQYPDENRDTGAIVTPMKEDLLGRMRTVLIVLMCAAGCVLLIACANLASLLLTRAVARKRELAVRMALGAGRMRLIRQMVTEGALLSLLGGALGLGFALAGMQVLSGLVPLGLPSTAKPGVDARLLLFTFALSLVTGLIFSLLPALAASRASVNDALKQGGRSGADTRGRRTRDALVALEVAAALVLLTGAGLMIETMAKLRAVDLGFRPDHLLTLRTPQGSLYDDSVKALQFQQRVLEQVRALPGVEAAAYASTLPFQSTGNTQGYRLEGVQNDLNFSPDALYRAGSWNYLQTLHVKLREGHFFDGSETPASHPVIIINETFARHYWPHQPAVGHRVSIDGEQAPEKWRTIVGVVEDVQERGYDLWMKPGFYIPTTQEVYPPSDSDYLVVRTKANPLEPVAAIRRIVASINPDIPVANVQTMDDIIDRNVVDRRQQMMLLGAFAALALALAAIGLYGVLSYAVTQRAREIGLRIALGASGSSVVAMVVRQGLALTGIGIAIGLAGSWAATRSLKNLLYGVTATDPVTFAEVAALLMLIALAACWIPARRASKVDPIKVLREE
ncbi:MAG TPA: ABC transporter permease [Candidatus Sulfopaludibacter sp.]|jgi:putative ABC transport system permease protein|nr:ABC transporter permease [Candidatus Sulfopaludibacter sp.]